MILLYLLIIWLTPIILFFFLVYIDMKKGESVKEYFKQYQDNTDVFFLLALPGANISLIFIFILLIIYKKIENFRK